MRVKIRRNRKAERELIERIRQKNTANRKPGLHMSDLLYCARKAKLRMDGKGEPPDDDAILTFSFGWAMHWLMEREPEVGREIEGLHYSPDEIDLVLESGKKIVVDFKGTRRSSAKGPTEMGNYIDQLGAYALMEGTNLGRLQVLHYVGQYGGKSPVTKSDGKVEVPKPFSAQHRAYDMEFNEEELVGWGRELGRRRRLIEQAQDVNDISLDEHFAWECEYCEFKGKQCPGGGGQRMPWFGNIEIQEDIP